MARTQTETASQNADAGCSYLNLNSKNATYNASGDNRLVLQIENAGTRNAVVSKIRITADNLNTTIYSHPDNFTGTLDTGDQITVGLVVNTTWINSIGSVRVIPADCPQSAITIKNTEITSYA